MLGERKEEEKNISKTNKKFSKVLCQLEKTIGKIREMYELQANFEDPLNCKVLNLNTKWVELLLLGKGSVTVGCPWKILLWLRICGGFSF